MDGIVERKEEMRKELFFTDSITHNMSESELVGL